MAAPSSSVLVVSYRRPTFLAKCLASLAAQTTPADSVVVVWQADDTATRDEAERARPIVPTLRVVHSPEAGVVAAENVGLDATDAEIILLADDDVVAPPDWVARHLAFYDDPTVGAVGGPAVNMRDGRPFPIRAVEPIGTITPLGRVWGNMHDHPPDWRDRPPREVHHLVGYNMSLRRKAFGRFESDLLRYWQMFEMDACLQVRDRGYRVIFDFANVVEHHPTNTAYDGIRLTDIQTKVYNSSFNLAYVLSKHTGGALRPIRLLYQLGVGTVATPGLAGYLVCVRRFGHPAREAGILWRAIRHKLSGWSAGRAARRRPAAVAGGDGGPPPAGIPVVARPD